MVDERLTSQSAKSFVREQNQQSGGHKQDLTKIDHIAAAMILQSWLMILPLASVCSDVL